MTSPNLSIKPLVSAIALSLLATSCGGNSTKESSSVEASSTPSSVASSLPSSSIASSESSSVSSSTSSNPSFNGPSGAVFYDVAPYNVVGSGDCSNTYVCADFEQGLAPATGNASRDTSIGYKSNASFRVNSNQSTFLQLDVPSSDFWVRTFVRGSGSQQAPNQGFALAHGVLIKAREGARELRVGDHRCQLELNRWGSDWSDDLEMTSGSYGDNNICNEDLGARMKPNTWYCLEVHYNGPASEVQVFWDNQNVEQLHVKADRIATNADKDPEQGYNGQYGDATKPWGPANYTHVEFGYVSFNNGGSPNATFWFDNVATASDRIGCGEDYQAQEALHSSTRYPGYQQDEGLPDPIIIP